MKGIVDKYRELEQIRFIDYSIKTFNPELLDSFLGVIDAVFDVRLPHLLHILRQYERFPS